MGHGSGIKSGSKNGVKIFKVAFKRRRKKKKNSGATIIAIDASAEHLFLWHVFRGSVNRVGFFTAL